MCWEEQKFQSRTEKKSNTGSKDIPQNNIDKTTKNWVRKNEMSAILCGKSWIFEIKHDFFNKLRDKIEK